MKRRYVLPTFLLILTTACIYFFYPKNQKILFDKHVIDAIHSPKINAFFEKADGYKYAQNYPKAKALFEALLSKSKRVEDSLYAYNQLIYCVLAMNEDSLAAQYFKEFDTHFPNLEKRDPSVLGDYFYNKGVFSYRVFHPKEAEFYLQKSLNFAGQIYDSGHLKHAQCLATLGVLHYEYAHTPDSAFLYLPKAYAIFQKNKDALNGSKPECLLGMAMISRSKRQYDEATGYCEEALNILENQPFENQILIARALVEKARAVNMRRMKASKAEDKQRIEREVEAYFQKAIAICPKNSVRLQECHQLFTRHLGRLDSVSDKDFKPKFWQQLADLEQVIKNQKTQKLGFPDYLKGVYYDNVNQADSALNYLSVFTKAYQNDSLHSRTTLAESYINMVYIYEDFAEKQKKPIYLDSALNCFKMNLLNYADDKDVLKPWLAIIEPKFYEKVSFQFAPLSGVSRLLLNKYQATGDKNSLDLTLKIVKLVDGLLFSGITSQDDDAFDFFQNEAAEDIYNPAIIASSIMYELTKNKMYLDDVFRFGERRRSFLLYRDADVRDTSSIETPPQYMRDKIRYLESEINQLKWATEKGQSSNIALMEKQNLREQLYADMKNKYPNFYRLKVVQPLPKIDKIQSELTTQQCFVQFTFSKKALHALFIRKNATFLHQTPWDSTAENSVFKLCSYMNGATSEANLTAQTYSKTAFDVYKKLFPIDNLPFENLMKGCAELVISPDGQLNSLPFEALVTAAEMPKLKFNNLAYLIQKYAVTYTPSWKIFETNHLVKLPIQANLRAYTYDFESKELPSAKTEFANLTRLFSQNSSFAIGKNASVNTFLSDTIQAYDILHLSLHAQSDPQSKYNNTIYFGPHRQDSINGFRLLNRPFKEKLVVLSACQSAFGKIKKGEGTYALSRIFLRVGVPHVVASLWSVSDATTEKITTLFYQNLVNQHFTSSESLNQAKRQFLKSADELTGQPRFWAGLVCVD
jgi:CHAT domain-containing protein